MSLLQALNPRSVAILGASDNPIKPGGRPIDYMLRHGFSGAILPVNPKRNEVQGLPAYPSLRVLPQAPDAVVISLPGEEVANAIDECVDLGARMAVIYSSGFAELGDAGRAQQSELLARARRGGLRLFGPNCQGVANFAQGAILNFSTMINESPPADGPVAIVSQSGAGAAILYGGLRRAGLGVRYMVSTGNEADVCAAEAACALLGDEQVRLVVLYVETLSQSAQLAQAARLARERGAHILAVKAGRTSAGQATASSHTGALAAEDALTDSFLRQHGILRLADFRELIDYAPLFLSQPMPRGQRVVSISNSGATCVLSADAAEEYGLAVEQFDQATLAGLKQALPPYVTARNPIDMTTALLGKPDTFGHTLQALRGSNAADLVHVGFPIGGEGYDFADFAAQASRFARDSGIPIAVSVNQEWVARAFQEQGVPTFWSERAAMRGLALLSEQACAPASMSSPQQPPVAASTTLDEPGSLARLQQAGLPVMHHQVCTRASDVLPALEALGTPLVAKGISADLAHKSEHGLVRLNIDRQESALQAFHDFAAKLRALEANDGGMLLCTQHKADFELALGAHIDAEFGVVVMIGQGGVLVETLKDVQFLLAPFDQSQALAAIQRLGIAPAFAAARGMPAVELSAVADMMVRLGDWMLEQDGHVQSVDANPVLVARGARPPVIVDAVVAVACEERS
ncbi:acetate--CoA ligase family protein [Comamonas composti]|uniref:acetate--CoA ligase family protein n=1 Tax=Comamonas composti TaxID=408558 RepID=UPI000404BDDA|nr:acetate--CoA ligase family protein [Comamonas composti]